MAKFNIFLLEKNPYDKRGPDTILLDEMYALERSEISGPEAEIARIIAILKAHLKGCEYIPEIVAATKCRCPDDKETTLKIDKKLLN